MQSTRTARPCPDHHILSACKVWHSSILTYAALQVPATVRRGLMHASLTSCLSRLLKVRPNVWHRSTGRSRCIALNKRGVACGHRPEDSDRPAWKERTDQARILYVCERSAQYPSKFDNAQVAQRVSTWVSGALDQFDTAVMPRERVSCVCRISLCLAA